MATKINVRSPFYLKVSQTNIATATLNLYIYTGTFVANASVANPKYTITKDVLTSGFIVFEVAELIRDYLEIEFDGTYSSQVVWVNAIISTTVSSGSASATVSPDNTNGFVAFDGYGYFHEGTNPELSKGALISNNTIFRLNDSNVRIPVYTGDTTSVAFFYQGVEKRTQAISSSTNTNAQIDYVTVSGQDNNDSYEERVVADGGTLETSSCLTDFLRQLDIGLVDEVYVASSAGTEVIKILSTEECKYEPYKVTFVNKYGALQDLMFFKKSVESTNVTSEQFKASIFDQSTLSYKTYQHQQQAFLAQGKDRITMNTGYVNDDHNSVLEELLLSEQVYYTEITETEEKVIPVIPLTKSITYKTSVNDRLANYTVEFEHAFDKINNIR
tara:strand:- start:475 stop:1635 length:1161 start_codon:yes stop_codon:yes gene_type:complete